MISEQLNSKVDKPFEKKDIIIEYDKGCAQYSDMLKAILSICNESDAAEFNKKIHVNRYDLIKVKDNKVGFSENIYELVIGLPNEMKWCEEVSSYYGLHICMVGKTAHIYVENVHTDKDSMKKFLEYASRIESEYKKIIKVKTTEGIGRFSVALWCPVEGKTFAHQWNNKEYEDRYIDVPKAFKIVGNAIATAFKWAIRKLGFLRQRDILDYKYKILIKDFYLHYFPMFIGVLNGQK